MAASPREQACLDNKVFNLAKSFLLDLGPVSPELLDRYLSVPAKDRPQTLKDIFRKLVFSAQNRHSLPKVIGGAIGSIERLSGILCDFEPIRVVERYAVGGDERLLDDIVVQLLSERPPRRESRSLWPTFCRSILSGAAFLAQFHDGQDFHAWVALFDSHDRARPALPAFLAHELAGFGFALACDFLKEMGYHNFCKPDVHLRMIFSRLKLVEGDSDDYGVYKAITRLAKNVDVTPYAADKVFWLISSGHFYNDGIEIGGHRDEFINYAITELARE